MSLSALDAAYRDLRPALAEITAHITESSLSPEERKLLALKTVGHFLGFSMKMAKEQDPVLRGVPTADLCRYLMPLLADHIERDGASVQ
jgi:hypothetical protein